MSKSLFQSGLSRPTTAAVRGEKARLAIFLAFLAICVLAGGSPRAEVQSLLLVRPAAVISMFAILLVPGAIDWRTFRTPLLLLGGFAASMVVQLIPLPPGVWTALPGHAPFAEAANAAGMMQPWRPISLAPDHTLNSLVSLVVPLAVIVGMAAISREARYGLLPMIIGVMLLSAALGIGQITGGSGSALRYYRTTNDMSAVGLFANRNHHSVMLAATLPMLMAWASLEPSNPKTGYVRIGLALAIGLLLLPTVLVTGSRAGMLLTLPALAAGWWLFGRRISIDLPDRVRRARPVLRMAPVFAALALIGMTIFLSRAEGLQRLIEQDSGGEARFTYLPVLLPIARDFLPFGAGYGAFDPIFRVYEPFELLKPTYLNHAHNDLLEVAIVGGVPGLAVVLALLFWLGVRAAVIWRDRSDRSRGVVYQRLALTVICLILIASLVDYPLRTPSIAAAFAICCCWLCAKARPVRSAPSDPNGGREQAHASLRSGSSDKRAASNQALSKANIA